ncbi:hypothetical protein OG963_04475 [Streptomyces sp. NBC_01707]|uniref:hypothetical protein n=1 Tax=Streptomyces sp. NBC_01707 TaxID=2975914 RepID=UPI00352C4C19
MAKLILTTLRYVTVDHSQFVLSDFDWDDREQPPMGDDDAPGVGEHSVRIMSLIHDHDVDVKVEVWDAEPPASKIPLLADTVFTSRSGIVVLDQLMGGPAGLPIPLGAPGRYSLRICRLLGFPLEDRGQVELSGRHDELETYLLQLWPQL